jgi:transcriptional regulator NrdR family protein
LAKNIYCTDDAVIRDRMVVKIIKKAEKFSEKKLRASLKKVRAVPRATKAAVEAVKKRMRGIKSMTTADIKKIVSGVLRKLDPRALKRYASFHKRK